MRYTLHSRQRMAQRGIPQRLVEFALRHGRIEGDRHVLDRKESRRVVNSMQQELRLALHVLDKGGITVVEGDDAVITTFNRDQPFQQAQR
jgi:hypothetical protein